MRASEKEEEPEFVRSETQKKIKDADDAVKKAQEDVGNAFFGFLDQSGLGSALGIGSRGNNAKKNAPATSGGMTLPSGTGKSGVQSKDLGRSGQSKKWIQARETLVKAGLVSISGEEARLILNKGEDGTKAVLLDVRPAPDYEDFHAQDSKSAQFYRYPDSSDLFDLGAMVRQVAYAAQGVKPVEKNKNFVTDAKEAIGDANLVIVACANGGTMTQTDNFPLGQASRSLLGAAELIEANLGFGKGQVLHLRGGLNSWFKDGGQGVGIKDAWDDTSGKVPFVPGFSVEQDAEELS